MDYNSSGNIVHVISGSENWSNEVWATEEDYSAWNNGMDSSSMDTSSNSNYDQRQSSSQSRAGSEPPNKKSKPSQQDPNSSNRSKVIGKMFFKTKLCCKFRAGTCPYVTNCNFAHSIEELRRPPPNWQEIVASHEEENGVVLDQREEHQIPSLGSSSFVVETQRSYKGRHCKKFYTEEGCPYGDNCTFLHDEQSKNRESVAISLGPGGYSGGGGGGSGGSSGGANSGGGGGGAGAGAGAGNGSSLKPSNWKTRICNKWELTGYCPFGTKCHFAHGAAELHRYGGGLVETESRDSSLPPDSKQLGGVPKIPGDTLVSSVPSAPHSDIYHVGVPSHLILQRPGQRAHQKWKGPDKISRIYGDWIDDME